MKKLNTIQIMALGLAACTMVSAVELVGGPEKIFDYTETCKQYDYYKERVVSTKWQAYFIFDQYDAPLATVWYWREGSSKYFDVDYNYYAEEKMAAGAAPSQKGVEEEEYPFGLDYLGAAGKTANFWLFEDWGEAKNGFGTARRARDGQLKSLSVSGTTCDPGYNNGTFRLRFNKSLTSKAAKSDLTALDYVIQELERKGYKSDVE